MTALEATPAFLKLLAHDLRWQLIHALAHSDYRVQELTSLVDRPMNLVSYHLRKLRDGNLVRERRSSADARDVYYSLDFEHVADAYRRIGVQLHPGMFGQNVTAVEPEITATISPHATPAGTPIRVLFLCTHNSARSQMAEALLRRLHPGQIEIFSAGTEPSRIHPLAVRAMEELGIDIGGQRSKHLDELQDQRFDYVITVCDRAREECPAFPGDPNQIHWSFADPAAVAGDEEHRLAAFRETAAQLSTRLAYFSLVAGDAETPIRPESISQSESKEGH